MQHPKKTTPKPAPFNELKGSLLLIGLLGLGLASCELEFAWKDKSDPMTAPIASKKPHSIETHGRTRVDPYYWMNKREDPEVIEYLQAENKYTKEVSKLFDGMEDRLYTEIRSRIKEDDESTPVRDRSFEYFVRYKKGEDYPRNYRRNPDSKKEELILDHMELAKGKSYFAIGDWEVSENEQLLAFSMDTTGRRLYEIFIKDLRTGDIQSTGLKDVGGGLEWANNDQHLYYSTKDPQTLRNNKVFIFDRLSKKSELIFEEKDEEFFVSLGKSKDRQFIFIHSNQTESNEVRYLPADAPTSTPRVFYPREKDFLYEIEHREGIFYVANNWNAKNFQIHRTQADFDSRANWELWLPHRDDTLIEDFDLYKDFVVIEERTNGLVRLRVLSPDKKTDYFVEFPETSYLAGIGSHFQMDNNQLRYFYTSMTTPESVYDFNLETKEKSLIKQKEVLGGFDPRKYKTERVFLKARDGVEIPVSLVYPAEFAKDGSAPLLLYGYGSYGNSLDAYFSTARLSLLDRGFVYAIAHVRGGEELGRYWYDDGKLLKKKNSFNDFVDVAKALVKDQWTQSDRLYAMGGSAGGLLMGAVINSDPQLFNGVVADVPFVDVVTTMLDESIPLTTFEYEEWGNPADPKYFDYMLSYSPYDNVKAQDYPHLLVVAGLHDSQVQYWEPAKWVAKLRDLKTDDNLLLLKTNMEAGHGGASARFDSLKEIAFEYAFLLYLESIRKKSP